MIEKGKISAFQMGIMMYPSVLATALLLVPSITAKHAERDLWLSPIWASSIGFLIVYIVYQLNKLYPKESIVEYSQHILGRIPGKLIGLIYLVFYLHINGIIIREYGEFVVSTTLLQTPMVMVLGSIVLVCAFAVRGGVEVLGRCAQFFMPGVTILFLLLIVLLIPDLHPKNMFPMMEHGLKPSFLGSVVPQGWFSEFMLISFLLPFLSDREKGMKWGMISVVAVMLLMVLTNFAILFLFGGVTGVLVYPVITAARYISLADFFEHLESIVMAIWVASAFVKISVFYYALVLGTSQWLNLVSYRPIVFPVGFLLVLFSLWVAPNLQELTHFLSTSDAPYLISVQIVIPILLLFIAFVRKKIQQKHEANK
ncbi:germination protein [Paenibacillus baekrokdamisoli]|uniref:Germination protein n=1 Tax=Paenibacillus baekrokdamisoli TaxID=1712516 RepID=A0A3G9ILC1_9BACL|nr:endospore germination permease [Paenibacillus baekrokdamisoli]MBB3067689.1 spore germination protein KB [Paenibacillus baekrokdamisoli]BBH19126.1 germination protein [Paenibacillus baekrokdamisoli]